MVSVVHVREVAVGHTPIGGHTRSTPCIGGAFTGGYAPSTTGRGEGWRELPIATTHWHGVMTRVCRAMINGHDNKRGEMTHDRNVLLILQSC